MTDYQGNGDTNGNETSNKVFIQNKKQEQSYKEKNKVVIISIIASSCLAILKLSIGFSTNSLAILSEAFHSGLDVLAAFMTLYAVRLVIKPPDLRYTYGYAKIESISSLAEILLLLLVAGWIFYEGIERIFFKSVVPEITIFSFLIMVTSIVVDYGRSKALFKIARKYGSQAIEADALHFRADMISSFIVIVGLIFVLILNVPNADAYAGIIIGGMIIYTSLGLGKRTLDVLLDKAPKGLNHIVLESIIGLEGVNRAHDLRIRAVGNTMFIDLHIEVPRTSTHDKAHKIATSVEMKIRQIISNADVLVHVDAIEAESETLSDRIKLIADEIEGIKNIHSIYLSRIPELKEGKSRPFTHNQSYSNLSDSQDDNRNNTSKNHLHLYLDIQVNNRLDLKTAHSIIEQFESRVKNEINEIGSITTHIEIDTSEDTKTIGVEKKVSQSYIQMIKNSCLSIDGVVECKDIGIVDMNGSQHITLTVLINLPNSSKISVSEAHKIATSVQEHIMKKTNAERVVVHTEPT
ncbi:MAG: cation-efflux pump [Nitrososphaeraceae archaeon]|nr:cation-efflux pump [Nitrososphaeraceae archaeon]